MQNPGSFGLTSAFQRNLGARLAREDTFHSDENAPPDPSKAIEDEIIPVANFASSRMIGALANSRESTPNTISAAQSPTGTNDNHLQPSRLGSNAPTLAGSVVAGVDSPPVGPLARMGIVFRADHTMVTTFDKKTDGELYDLWTA